MFKGYHFLVPIFLSTTILSKDVIVYRIQYTKTYRAGRRMSTPCRFDRKSLTIDNVHVQGDEEKQMGLTPIPMMDRTKKHELPQSQVSY